MPDFFNNHWLRQAQHAIGIRWLFLSVVVAVAVSACHGEARSLRPAAGLRGAEVPRRVVRLPGWDGPLPTEFYSGFVSISSTVPAGTTMNLHYTLHGKEGGTEEGTPLIVWFSGGPGAPSSYGLFVENGPLLTNEQGYTLPGYNATTGTPALVRNPYAWTKFAAVLEFANPPPTGFSYCTPAGPANKSGAACGEWDDERVGAVLAEGLHKILSVTFPTAFRTSPIFLIGESYAGVYIAALVAALTDAQQGYPTVARRVRGVALGDACMGYEQICGDRRGPGAWLDYLYFNAQLPTTMWNDVRHNCSEQELRWGIRTESCKGTVSRAYAMAGTFDSYNLDSTCPTNAFDGSTGKTGFTRTASSAVLRAPTQQAHANGYWCAGRVFRDYMNLPAVRDALGVAEDSHFFLSDDGRGMPYNESTANTFPVWAARLRQHPNTTTSSTMPPGAFRLLSYNGDLDVAVPVQVVEAAWYAFARNRSYSVSSEWSPWTVDNTSSVVGGHAVRWLDGRVIFATVRGAGHMVPEFRSQAASTLIRRFVHEQV